MLNADYFHIACYKIGALQDAEQATASYVSHMGDVKSQIFFGSPLRELSKNITYTTFMAGIL
jgi:hypothetical protein